MGFKPSGEEEKWAQQQDIDVKKEFSERISKEDRQRIKKSDLYECPKDKTKLVPIELNGTGIIVNKCETCGGIWFDRKNIERCIQHPKSQKDLIKILSKTIGIEFPDHI
ncbi:MAG: hypothetical protein ACD_20C00379G0002 [uncultured bacterium]|nr:MAG: hypothetical protein ACD_20C00379G0002 [uncultured bacterium]HBH18730.1 hypothetical protein [Cyanobacteria bacterium UBA9579]